MKPWSLYSTRPSQATFTVLLTKQLAHLHDFVLMWCGSGHTQQIFVFQGYKMSALNPNQSLPPALRSQREQVVTNGIFTSFHVCVLLQHFAV